MVNPSYPNRHIKLCSRMSSKIKDQEEVNDFSLDLDMAALSLKSRNKMSEDFDFNSNLIVTGPAIEDLAKIRQLQIDLLGSELMYEKINKILKRPPRYINPYYIKETFDLFAWRMDFFDRVFGLYYEEEIWTCDGGDDAHGFDTVPLQITRNFDYVVELACSTLDLTGGKRVYFEADEDKSGEARNTFDRDFFSFLCSEGEWCDIFPTSLTFSEKVHRICATYPKGPIKLEEMCIKVALLHDLDYDVLPSYLISRVDKGMYQCTKEFNWPNSLSEEGEEVLEDLLKYLLDDESLECETDCICNKYDD